MRLLHLQSLMIRTSAPTETQPQHELCTMRVDDKTLEAMFDEKGDWLELQTMTKSERDEHMTLWIEELGGGDMFERLQAIYLQRVEHRRTCTGFVTEPMSPTQESETTKRKMCLRM